MVFTPKRLISELYHCFVLHLISFFHYINNIIEYVAFCIHVNSDEPYYQHIPAHVTLTLTEVTLEKSLPASVVSVYLHQDNMKFPICHLDEQRNRHHTLKLTFCKGETLHCSVSGEGVVSIIGYYQSAPIISAAALEDLSEYDLDSESLDDLSDSTPSPKKSSNHIKSSKKKSSAS